MRRAVITLALLLFLCNISSAQNTLYDGWITFSSKYLGADIWEYGYKWGANSTLSPEEIANLFPAQIGGYMRMFSGIGHNAESFDVTWDNPVDLLYYSTYGDVYYELGDRSLSATEVISPWIDWWQGLYFDIENGFTFTTRGFTGTQKISVDVDYYAYYEDVLGTEERDIAVSLAETPLRVTGSFTPIPEPATLLLLGSGLLGWAGLARFRARKKN